jgi:hypothetical protein
MSHTIEHISLPARIAVAVAIAIAAAVVATAGISFQAAGIARTVEPAKLTVALPVSGLGAMVCRTRVC